MKIWINLLVGKCCATKKKQLKKISWFFTDKIWSAGVFQWGWRQFQTNNNLISAWIYVNYTYIFICGGWTAGGGGTTFSVAVKKKPISDFKKYGRIKII